MLLAAPRFVWNSPFPGANQVAALRRNFLTPTCTHCTPPPPITRYSTHSLRLYRHDPHPIKYTTSHAARHLIWFGLALNRTRYLPLVHTYPVREESQKRPADTYIHRRYKGTIWPPGMRFRLAPTRCPAIYPFRQTDRRRLLTVDADGASSSA